jgi:thioredoxin 1
MRDVGDDSFEREVLQAERPVLVDFWAPWCGPCHAITPVLQSLEDELGDRVEFIKVNVDENPVTASRYGVLSIPTVILFQDGEAKAGVLGARPRPHYERLLDEVLPAA